MLEQAVKEQLKRTIQDTQVYFCYECGKCTSRCPISRYNGTYSPRRVVGQLLQGGEEELLEDPKLWSCLTCGACTLICPSDVDYVGFTRDFRGATGGQGCGWCTHGGALHSWMRLMAENGSEQKRLEWLDDDLEVSEEGEVLYFVGCLPYFEAFFGELAPDATEIARSTVRVLNAAGVKPVMMKDERCCGHDLLWQGDVEAFRKLAAHNIEEIKKTGAKKVVTACAECARTLDTDYPKHIGPTPFQVMHLAEFLAESGSQLPLKEVNESVTYQDPCRLGRHLEVYEEPRQAMTAIPGLELREMPKNRKDAICCGTSTWMNCDRHSKQIQDERLENAQRTGADVLITACPKCSIHFRCSQMKEGSVDSDGMEIKDLAVLLSEALEDKAEERA